MLGFTISKTCFAFLISGFGYFVFRSCSLGCRITGCPPRLVSGKDLQSDVKVERAIQFAIGHKDIGIMDHGAIHYNIDCSCLSIAWLAPDGFQPHARFLCAAYAGYSFKLAKAYQNYKNPSREDTFLADQTFGNVMHSAATAKNMCYYFCREGDRLTADSPKGPVKSALMPRALTEHHGNECHFSRIRGKFPSGHMTDDQNSLHRNL